MLVGYASLLQGVARVDQRSPAPVRLVVDEWRSQAFSGIRPALRCDAIDGKAAAMSRLDETRLENVRRRGERIICRCPACFEQGHDKTGNHLSIQPSGAFACVQFPGDEGIEHRKRIFALVGVRNETGPRTFPTLDDAIGFMVQKL